MIFPRTRRARQRYGRNKVIAILVTFAVVWGFLRYVLPRGDFLRRFERAPQSLTPSVAWKQRRSGVVVGATGAVQAVLPDSVKAQADGDGPERMARVRFLTEAGHPLVLLYDPVEGGETLEEGETVTFLGVFQWSTGGGVVRAFAADSSAFGVTRSGG